MTYLTYGIIITLRGGSLQSQTVFKSMAMIKLFTQPLLDALDNIPVFLQSLASMERIHSFLAEDIDSTPPTALGHDASWSFKDSGMEHIQFSNLGHTYDGNEWIFSGLTGRIEQGSLALVLGWLALNAAALHHHD